MTRWVRTLPLLLLFQAALGASLPPSATAPCAKCVTAARNAAGHDDVTVLPDQADGAKRPLSEVAQERGAANGGHGGHLPASRQLADADATATLQKPGNAPKPLTRRRRQLTDKERSDLSKKLVDAAEKDKFEDVLKLLMQGADPNHKGEKGYAPLHWAGWNGNVDALRLLIARGATVDILNDFGNTPLHWAAWAARLAAVQFLAGKGANVNAVNSDGETPLIFAAERKGENPVGTVRALLALGADPSIRSNAGTTARDRASSDEIRDMLPT